MRSAALRHVRSRQKTLKKDFLPSRFSRLGVYNDQQRSLAGAFRVFFYAELEVYFETIAKELASFADTEWALQRASVPAMALSSMQVSKINAPEETSQIQSSGSYLHRRFRGELEKQRKRINDNNGAKSSNILKMLCPLGVDETRIDPSLLSECDTIGSDRGFAVHRSPSVTHLIDPQSEYDRATRIITLLDDFETVVKSVSPLKNF
jgi:hypothetical protein